MKLEDMWCELDTHRWQILDTIKDYHFKQGPRKRKQTEKLMKVIMQTYKNNLEILELLCDTLEDTDE